MKTLHEKYEILRELLFRVIVDCILMSRRQRARKCTKNKEDCGRFGCIYYLRCINSCVGRLETDRCDDCLVKSMGLQRYCKVIGERYNYAKQRGK